ncbi:MAG: HDOD domain-containing protein [Candidatus Eisenbacteria bacterium]|uniref:HDOD domain-containing protein n=1 Tax=Eiseniibacteriota bacterium TaxID=2212470 RepID=A0A956M0Z1_UNCEI|nr:HDOD domain-containing protein [Candidatus Eisenbacteria bacterium]
MSAIPAAEDRIRRSLEARIETNQLELPLLPTSVAQVLELCYSPDASAAKLSEVIHRDQALASHLLRVANSPAYFPGTAIVSLQQAISRLGQRTIGEIAVALSVKGLVFNERRFQSEMRSLWRQSAASGAFAREIARTMRRSVDTALLCGLLQNVGKPAVIHLVTKVADTVGREVDNEEALELAEEYHTEVGARMVEGWSMPPAVIETTRYHHHYADAPTYPDEARVVHLSDRLAENLLSPQNVTEEMLRAELAFAELNLYPEDVDAILAKGDDVRKFVEVIG